MEPLIIKERITVSDMIMCHHGTKRMLNKLHEACLKELLPRLKKVDDDDLRYFHKYQAKDRVDKDFVEYNNQVLDFVL